MKSVNTENFFRGVNSIKRHYNIYPSSSSNSSMSEMQAKVISTLVACCYVRDGGGGNQATMIANKTCAALKRTNLSCSSIKDIVKIDGDTFALSKVIEWDERFLGRDSYLIPLIIRDLTAKTAKAEDEPSKSDNDHILDLIGIAKWLKLGC